MSKLSFYEEHSTNNSLDYESIEEQKHHDFITLNYFKTFQDNKEIKYDFIRCNTELETELIKNNSFIDIESFFLKQENDLEINFSSVCLNIQKGIQEFNQGKYLNSYKLFLISFSEFYIFKRQENLIIKIEKEKSKLVTSLLLKTLTYLAYSLLYMYNFNKAQEIIIIAKKIENNIILNYLETLLVFKNSNSSLKLLQKELKKILKNINKIKNENELFLIDNESNNFIEEFNSIINKIKEKIFLIKNTEFEEKIENRSTCLSFSSANSEEKEEIKIIEEKKVEVKVYYNFTNTFFIIALLISALMIILY